MKELLFDPITNSSNEYHKNCMADSNEILGAKGLKREN